MRMMHTLLYLLNGQGSWRRPLMLCSLQASQPSHFAIPHLKGAWMLCVASAGLESRVCCCYAVRRMRVALT